MGRGGGGEGGGASGNFHTLGLNASETSIKLHPDWPLDFRGFNDNDIIMQLD